MKITSTIALGLGLLLRAAANGAEVGQQWDVFETSYKSDKAYTNAFVDVEVDVVFRQGEKQWKVPAFWAGGDTWKVRFAPPAQGKYTYCVESSDKSNAGLNGKEQTLQVSAYTGKNPLLQHGFLKVSADKRHFEHADDTPFFWLGDTWWKGLCKRLTWEGFQELTADRKAKGFSVVQLVCGTYPDEGLFQPGWENEGGKPYETRDYSVVNPTYFEYADRRIRHLVENGILPVVVGGWGRGDCDGMAMAGLAGIKRHWRNLVARYGACPTVWIIGGETGGAQWSEVTRYVHGLDPYDRPVTIHNPANARTALTDEKLLDFDMLETSHEDWTAAQLTLTRLKASYSAQGMRVMPVMVGEACYEGHMQRNWQDVQRHVFWSTLLSGSAGHTYGAAGIWHVGVEGDSGHVAGHFGEPAFDWTTWREGMNYPGSTQIGLGKKLLEQYPWARFEPHPEWAPGCFAAGIPNGMRVIYLPRRNIYNWSGFTVNNLQPGVPYSAFYFDPATGRRFDQGIVTTASGSWKTPNVPSPQDWVLVMQAPDFGAPVILPGATAGKAYSGRLLPEGAAFVRRAGPDWVTVQADGRVSGTPGETDAGLNVWIVSVTKAGSQPAFIQLQIAVAGSPGLLFAENFSRYSGNQNETQYQSGLNVAYNGNADGWTPAGAGAMHAVDRANPAGQSNPPDWAVLIWQDNVITSRAFAANFEYKGDGSGNIRLRIGPSGTLTSGRFQGAIDHLIVREMK